MEATYDRNDAIERQNLISSQFIHFKYHVKADLNLYKVGSNKILLYFSTYKPPETVTTSIYCIYFRVFKFSFIELVQCPFSLQHVSKIHHMQLFFIVSFFSLLGFPRLWTFMLGLLGKGDCLSHFCGLCAMPLMVPADYYLPSVLYFQTVVAF